MSKALAREPECIPKYTTCIIDYRKKECPYIDDYVVIFQAYKCHRQIDSTIPNRSKVNLKKVLFKCHVCLRLYYYCNRVMRKQHVKVSYWFILTDIKNS
jgi:hypothetical protein